METFKIYTFTLLACFAPLILYRSCRLAKTALCRPLYRRALVYLVYPRIFPQRHWLGINPTRFEVSLFAIHIGITALCNAYRISSLSAAGARAGQLAVAHLVPLITFRQLSFMADLLGISLNSIHTIHQALGIMATLQGIVHCAILLQTTHVTSTDSVMGLLCFTALLLLALLPLVRRYAYEAFLYCHLALAILAAVTIWEHLRLKRRFFRMLLMIASGTFIVTSAAQYVTQAYRNISWSGGQFRSGHIAWTRDFGSSLVVEVRLSRPWIITPGQYIYLKLLSFRHGAIFQSHPLMITWWRTVPGESEARSIFVVIRRQRGWTERVIQSASTLNGCSTWLSGPHGTPCQLQEFGTVLMFASGDGIFAQLPLIKSLTDMSKLSATKTRRIKVVWQTEEYHNQLQKWMQSILDDEEISLDLLDMSIHTFTSKDETQTDFSDPKIKKIGQRLKVIHDVPDVQSYVQLEMRQPRRNVAVTVSGYSVLRDEVRAQVLATKRMNVQLVELDFQPATEFRHRGGTAA